MMYRLMYWKQRYVYIEADSPEEAVAIAKEIGINNILYKCDLFECKKKYMYNIHCSM